MVASEFVKVRLPPELKQRVKALSERQLLSESAWLKRLLPQDQIDPLELRFTEVSAGRLNAAIRWRL